MGKLSWIVGLEVICNIHCKSLRKKETSLLTSARGKFGLWKMVEKIKTCGRRRIDGGHKVICNVGPNAAVLNVGLRSGDVASSYNGGVGLSSSNVFTNNTRFLAKNGFDEEEEEEESG